LILVGPLAQKIYPPVPAPAMSALNFGQSAPFVKPGRRETGKIAFPFLRVESPPGLAYERQGKKRCLHRQGSRILGKNHFAAEGGP